MDDKNKVDDDPHAPKGTLGSTLGGAVAGAVAGLPWVPQWLVP